MSRTLASAVLGFAIVTPAAFAQTLTDTRYTAAPYVTGFSQPTGIKFLGHNPSDFFVIEKNTGRVKRHLNGVTSTVLDLNVDGASERGLLGVELDPNFATNGFVYLYHSTTTGAADTAGPPMAGQPDPWVDNRVTRHQWSGTSLSGGTLIRTFGTAADGQANGANHDAGPLRFGPDGKLYGTTGDLNRNRAEQNNTAQAGSSAIVGGIYRINADGTVPADNPFIAHANTELRKWYAYGVRNTFGIAFDPLTGNLWDTENGPNTNDEINLVARGFNSGWNKVMGPADPGNPPALVVLPNSAYSDPEYTWVDTNAPTGINFLANSTLDGDYRDAVIVGDSNRGQLYVFRLNAARTAFTLVDIVANNNAEADLQRFGQGFSSITEIITGPDGGVYVTGIGNGTIHRVGAPSWKTNGNSTWGNSANWVGGVIPSGVGAKANFFGTITAPVTVLNDGERTVGSLTFNSDHAYRISGASTLRLDSSTGPALINVIKGSHTIASPQVHLHDHTTIHVGPAAAMLSTTGDLLGVGPATHFAPVTVTKTGLGTLEAKNVRTTELNVAGGLVRILPNGGANGVVKLNALTVAPGATLHLSDNDLIVDYADGGPSPYVMLRNYVLDGRDGAGGIVTTTAPGNDKLLALGETSDIPAITSWLGQTIDDDTVIGKYTYLGDANLDGQVTTDDYVAVDLGLATGTRWTQGDFDMNNAVTTDDYVIIDLNLGKGTAEPAAFAEIQSAMIALHAEQFGEAYLARLAYVQEHGFAAVIPEPGAIALLAAAGLLAQRRRLITTSKPSPRRRGWLGLRG